MADDDGDAERPRCDRCFGTGIVWVQYRVDGRHTYREWCSRCGGTGTLPTTDE